MTTYRLGFYGFDELAWPGAAGAGDVRALTSPGAHVVLAGAKPVLTPVLVEISAAPDADQLPDRSGIRTRIASGSSFGVEGQEVDLDCRLTLVAEDAPACPEICEVLSLDGLPVGFLAAKPLRPGVTYRITDRTAVDTGTVLGGLDPAAGPEDLTPVWDAVFCFTFGTLVDTPDGQRLIEELRTGDLVTTLGNGSQRLRWIGNRHVPATEMLQVPDLQPVEFAVGAIGNARPLRVSPQHRILLNDWRSQVFFGEDEVLIPAKAMVNARTIRQVVPPEGVTYIHLLFDRHEIIVSEGALSESFHPGEAGLLALDEAQRREVEQLFPGLELLRRRAAFPIVKLTEARALRLPD